MFDCAGAWLRFASPLDAGLVGVRGPLPSLRSSPEHSPTAALFDRSPLIGVLSNLHYCRARSSGSRRGTRNEIIAEWFAAVCPNVLPTKASRHAGVKSPNTVANARQLLGTSVRPVIGRQWVDRTTTERLEGAGRGCGPTYRPRPGSLRSPLSHDEQRVVRDWRDEGGYERALATIVAEDPGMANP